MTNDIMSPKVQGGTARHHALLERLRRSAVAPPELTRETQVFTAHRSVA
ncbi:MAG TPA: hypothetical protein VHC69_03765 [Polyangiaceae bacterium]|nr:hypothetical protein [Polyangiaceae bacterium]